MSILIESSALYATVDSRAFGEMPRVVSAIIFLSDEISESLLIKLVSGEASMVVESFCAPANPADIRMYITSNDILNNNCVDNLVDNLCINSRL